VDDLVMTELHHAQVIASPWEGVYCTHLDSARHFGKHTHATHGVGLLEQGAQVSASGRGVVEAFAGDLITTNPGEVHDGRPLGGPSRRWRMVYFEPGVIAAATDTVAHRAGNDIELAQPVVRDPRLAQAFRRLLDRIVQRAATPGLDLACDEALVEACALLTHRPCAAGGSGADPALAQVRARLADDLEEAPSLAVLALQAGMSKYQLLRRFANAYGITPHAWLVQQRAEHVRGAILRGEDLAQSAASAGFADQSHMTRIFTRQFGFTPGAWQRAVGRRASLSLPGLQ
jgi:AraC-like DNA-binding protein